MLKEITGTIDHRILLNYRIDPDVMKNQMPSEFTPKLVDQYAIGGICQVSLSDMRPKGVPNIIGSRSHNAAHRVAIVSSQGEGVYVPRRDTSSWLNAFSGGRLFPGTSKKANFAVNVDGKHYVVDLKDRNGTPLMYIDATISDAFPEGSVFRDTAEISKFFENGNIGWSRSVNGRAFDAIELHTVEWCMEPLQISREFSGYFTDLSKFPAGSVEFDSAMIMRGLRHSWISKDSLSDLSCE